MFDAFQRFSAALINFIIYPIYTLGLVAISPIVGLVTSILALTDYRVAGLKANDRSPNGFIHFIATLTYIISTITTIFYYSLINFFISPIVGIAYGITREFSEFGALFLSAFADTLAEADKAGEHAANTMKTWFHKVYGYPLNSTVATNFVDLERDIEAQDEQDDAPEEPNIRVHNRFQEPSTPRAIFSALGIMEENENIPVSFGRLLINEDDVEDNQLNYALNILAATLHLMVYPIYTLFSVFISPFLAFISSSIASVSMILMGEDENYQLHYDELLITSGLIRAICSMTYIVSSIATNLYYNLINFFTSPVVAVMHGLNHGFTDFGSLYFDTFEQTVGESVDAACNATKTMHTWLKKVFGYPLESDGILLYSESPAGYPSTRRAVHVPQAGVRAEHGINPVSEAENNLPPAAVDGLYDNVLITLLSAIRAGLISDEDSLQQFIMRLSASMSPQQPPVSEATQNELLAPVENTPATRALWQEALRGEGNEAPKCPILYGVPDANDAALLQKQYRNHLGQWQPVPLPGKSSLFSYEALSQQFNTNNVHPLDRDPIENPNPEIIDGIRYSGQDVRYRIIRLSEDDAEAVARINALQQGVDSNPAVR